MKIVEIKKLSIILLLIVILTISPVVGIMNFENNNQDGTQQYHNNLDQQIQDQVKNIGYRSEKSVPSQSLSESGSSNSGSTENSFIRPSDLPITTQSIVPNPGDISIDSTLDEGVDAQTLTYSTDTGDGQWAYQTTTTHDGTDAVEVFTTRTNGNTATITMTTTFSGKGLLEFYWRRNTFDAEVFLSVDGVDVEASTEETYYLPLDVWHFVRANISTTGFHTIEWRAEFNIKSVNTSHKIFVDEITYYPNRSGYVQITNPTSTSKWTQGSSNQITWNNPLDIDYVDIELWRDNSLVSTLKTNYQITRILGAYTFFTNSYTATLPDSLSPSTNYTIRLSDIDNRYNNATSAAFEVVSSISIGDAIEAPFFTYDNNGWSSYVEDTYDGIDSIKSKYPSSNGQYQSLSTQIEGTGQINFYVKTIGTSNDRFDLLVDSSAKITISGSSSWTYYSVNLDTVKTHTVTWRWYQAYTYEDDYFGALVDNVTYIPGSDALNIVSPSASSSYINGTSYDIDWYYSGTFTDVSIELYKNSVFHSTIAASTPNDKVYSWLVPNTLASGSEYQVKITSTTNSSITAMSDMFTITILTFEEALDYTPDSITSGGNVAWGPVLSPSYDGVDGVKSGSISDNQVSWLNMTLTGTGFLTFYWQVDSLAGDNLNFYVDNVLISTISGSVSFTLLEYIISTGGTHTISWSYSKDESGSSGTDAGFVDKLSFNTSADEVIVTNPNDSTTWLTNMTHTITWDFIGGTTDVKIELHKAGVLYKILSSSTPNDGSFDWVISLYEVGANDYSIYIQSTTSPSNNDTSGQFTLEETPHIKVLNPISSTIWTRQTTQTIQWNETGSFSNVKIELYDNGVFYSTISSSTANDGAFAWSLGTSIPEGNQYSIVITATTDGSYTDTSETFTILKPVITLTNPVSSSIWTNNTLEYIRWTWTGSFSNVIIELHNSTGIVSTISALTANDGEFLWQIPLGMNEGNYTIKIISNSDATVIGLSGTFEIEYPISINEAVDNYDLTFTNTGDYPWFGQQSYSTDGQDAARAGIFPSGNDATLISSVDGSGVITFSYRHDGAQEFNDINFYVDNNNQEIPFSWNKWTTVSIEISEGGQHELEWYHWKFMADDGTVGSVFLDNITWSPYPDNVIITGPETGKTMAVGGTYGINYQTNGTSPYVALGLYQSNSLVYTIDNSELDSGSYYWTIASDVVPGTYQLRVSKFDNSSAYDEITVIIEDRPTLTISSPSAGEEFEEYSTYSINWEVTGTVVTHVRVQLYKSTSLITDFGIVPDNGSIQWTVPDTLVAASDYRFRINSANQSAFYTYGNYFSIDDVHELSIIQPLSSSSWPNATDVTILWDSNGTFGNVGIEVWQGGIFYSSLTTSTPNDGSYLWSIPGDFGLGSYQIFIYQSDNSMINATSATFQITENINLDQATDSNFNLTTGGDSIWIGQSTTTFAGGDAVEAGAISDNQQVWIEFTFFGSGNLTFYWKVSSQATDYLSLYIDGILITQISGEVDWVQYTASITDGSSNHTVRWVYQKDASGSTGADSAWIDLVEIILDSDKITVTSPISSDLWERGNNIITWTSSGTIAYVNISLYLNSTLFAVLVTNLQNDGTYKWFIDDTFLTGSGYEIYITVSDNPAAVGVSESFSLFILDYYEAVDNFDIPITSGGWYDWTVTESVFYQDGDAVRAGIVPGSKISWIEFTVNGTGWFYFYLKFDVGFLDDVIIDVTGQSNQYLDGVQDWTLMSVYVDRAGINTIRITYDNYSSADSSEFVYIDAISWVPDNQALVITSPGSGLSITTGDWQQFYWDFNGTSTSVTIELYQLGTFVTSIVSSTPNDGYVSFYYPSVTNGEYQLRISSIAEPLLYDEITINVVDPFANITSPTSSSEVEIGRSFAITFDYLGDDWFIIELWLNGSALLNLTQYENNGYYSWIPSSGLVPGIGYQIKVIYSTDSSVFDFSDPFTLLPERNIFVDSPTTNSAWINGSNYNIQWSSEGPVNFVNISLYRDDIFVLSIVNNTLNDGVFSWNVPGYLSYSTGYSIKIFDSTDIGIIAESSDFIISHPITVLLPDATSIYGNMTYQEITWFAVDTISNVNIELYIDGVLYEIIAANIVNNGSLIWYIEDYYPETINAQIIIEDASNTNVFGISDNFMIDKADFSGNNAIDNYAVILSFSGDRWFGQNTTTYDGIDAIQSNPIGDSQETSMTMTIYGSGTLSFWFKISAESNDDLRIEYESMTVFRSGNRAWEYWEIDYTTGGRHDVKFRYIKNYITSANLDAVFVDQVVWTPDPSTISLNNPNSAGWSTPGLSTTIDWDYTGAFQEVYLELYQGGTYVRNITDGTPNTGSYSWVVPTDLSAALDYQVKIISLSDILVNDISEEFEIKPFISVQDALDTNLAISTNWVGQDNVTSDGIDALYSGERGVGEFTVTITVTGTGTFTFYWKSTSGYYNFYVDGSNKFVAFGGVSWTQKSVEIISSGEHTLTWVLDINYDTSNDKAWLDQIVWTPQENSLSNANTDKDSYFPDESITVTWETTGSIATVNIYLMIGSTVVGEALDIANTGSITLGLPTGVAYGSNYHIRIEGSNDNSIITDTPTFSIVEELYLTLTDNFSVEYSTGDSIVISWDASNSIETLNIDLYDGNSAVLRIVTGTENDGTFTWVVPSTVSSGTYSIMISGGNLESQSSTFVIRSDNTDNNSEPSDPVTTPTSETPQSGNSGDSDGGFLSLVGFVYIMSIISLIGVIHRSLQRKLSNRAN